MEGSATFLVSRRDGRLALEQEGNERNEADDFEKVLDEYCEPPVQCYRYLATGEVATVFTHMNADGSATTKRRRLSIAQPSSRPLLPIQTSKTSDGYGVEFQLKYPSQSPDAIESDSVTPANNSFSPGIARTRVRRTRQTRKRRILFRRKDDNVLLSERLDSHRGSLLTLSDRLGENPFIRCAHWYQEGRTFAFASAYVRRGRVAKALVAILWHTRTRPHRAVAVTFSIEKLSSQTDMIQERLVAHCSCCHLLTQHEESERGCYHAQTCFEDDALKRVVCSEIRRRENNQVLREGELTIFGEPITVESGTSRNLTVLLDRFPSNRKTLASFWLFFITFDVDLCLFTPVLKVKGKPYKCLLCRIPSSRRGICEHENCAKKACQAVRNITNRGSGLISGFEFMTGDGSDHEKEPSEPPQPSNMEERNEVEGETIGANRNVSEQKVFTPHVRRSILPCRGEWDDMMYISKILNCAKDGEVVVLDERNMAKCHKCGLLNTKENYDGYSRDMKLFTLFQGTHKIRVYDWWCHICEERRCFSGHRYGVFPVQQNLAFTTELLYQWVEMTCFQGYSFRNAYQTTKSMQRAVSRQMKQKKRYGNDEGNRLGNPSALNSDIELENDGTHRRRANDALREFIKLLDTNSRSMTAKFFSCSTCEVPLSATDCAELGVSEEEGKMMKRLKAVVIDGTASGILTELPTYDRDNAIVSAPNSISVLHKTQKVIKKNPHRKALKKLFKAVKTCFRVWKKAVESAVSTDLVQLRDDTLRIWMTKSDNIAIKGFQDPTDTLTKSESKIIQLFLSDYACFCLRKESDLVSGAHLVYVHNKECMRLKTIFSKTKESQAVIKTLRVLFSVTRGKPMDHLRFVDENKEQSDTPLQNEEQRGNVLQNGEQRDNRLQSNGERVHSNTKAATDVGRDNRMTNQTLAEGEAVDNDTVVDNELGDTDDSDDDELYDSIETQKKQVFGVWATLLLPGSEKHSQFVESTFLLLEFLLTDHVALPYVGTGSHANTEPDEQSSSSPRTMTDFTGVFFKLHVDLICAMKRFLSPCTGDCRCQEPSSSSFDCASVSSLKALALSVSGVNPILATFCQELIKLRKPLQSVYHCLVDSVISVLEQHMETAKKYFEKLNKHCSEQCKSYWRTWAGFEIGNERQITSGNDSETNQRRTQESSRANGSSIGRSATTGKEEDKAGEEKEWMEADSSGICFPGRRRVRPCIVFKSKCEEGCNKNYKKSKSHSPGLLTVQCGCDAPKLIGFVVMTQAESTAMALSAVLSHFRVFPKTVYYDNACNLFLSTMLRVPWLLGKTRFLVDRFHFKSHKCSTFFDPDSYAEFDADHTETAESINARIEKTLHQIRYLRGDNLVSFLRARFSFINLAATFRATYQKDDLEDVDMTQFFQNIFHCSCESCEDGRKFEVEEEN